MRPEAVPVPAAEVPRDDTDAAQGIELPEDQESRSTAGESDAQPGSAGRTETGEGERTRPRVQLNPSVSPEQDRAVPSYTIPAAPSSGAQEGSSIDSQDALEAAARVAAPPGEAGSEERGPAFQHQPPVELPPKNTELDAALEAEIEAAMAGEQQAASLSPEQIQQAEAAAPPEQKSEETLQPGTRLKGAVQSVTAEDVFLELGYRCPGILQRRQFPPDKPPQVGQKLEVVVDHVNVDEGQIAVSLLRGVRKVRGNWDELAAGQIVECLVTKTNKGGLEVTVGSVRGFMPAGQVETRFVSDLEPYVGQKLQARIIEANPRKRNLVLSRRAILEEQRKEAAKGFWETVEVGQKFTGTVKTLKDYGAFIDIGGVDGFLHVGEISWMRVNKPSDVLHEGQQVEVVIVSLDKDKQKIGLGMRQLVQNPWAAAEERYAKGTTVSGKVTRATDFGAFVELEPGVEGLIHISELDHRRVRRVADVLNVGQTVDAQVLEVQPDKQRISLSLKALKARPEEQRAEEEAASEPVRRKRRDEDLRGGTGPTGGGGLFGDPRDFSKK